MVKPGSKNLRPKGGWGKLGPPPNFISPDVHARWLIERQDLWQMRLLDPRDLSSHVRERGLNFSAEDIIRLWHLRILKADLVLSERPVGRRGLLLIGRDPDQRFAYGDARVARRPKFGWAGSAAKAPSHPGALDLRFHPFRYWILFSIKWWFSFDIIPMQALNSAHGYQSLGRLFSRLLARREVDSAFKRRNQTVALLVQSEPCTYASIFGTVQYPFHRSSADQQRLIAEHAVDVNAVYKRIPLRELEHLHRELCLDAYRLDSNRNIYTALRLAKGRSRLEAKDDFGGAVSLRTMAEVLRRMTEKAHEVQLPEEDHAGVGHTSLEVRERIYGSRRLFDGDLAVRREFLRQFELGSGSRVRWYVEGSTEDAGLRAVFGETEGNPITIVNLRGNVVRGDLLAFRDALRDDVRNGVFSVVSLDADREDYARAARKAAEDDEICGHLYIHVPDFEFANFSRVELEEIVWDAAERGGAAPAERLQLHSAVAATASGGDFLRAAVRAIPLLARLGKGSAWGQLLMDYAFRYPRSQNGTERLLIQAVRVVTQATRVAYNITRKEYRVDPKTGGLAKRAT
jgi:hypothetical protein